MSKLGRFGNPDRRMLTVFRNGVYTLVALFVVGLCLGISTSQLSVEKFTPYSPLATGVGLLAVSKTAPILRTFLTGVPIPHEHSPGIPMGNVDLESGTRSVDQESVQSDGQINRVVSFPPPWSQMTQLFHVGALFTEANNPIVSSSAGSNTDTEARFGGSETSSDLSSGSTDGLV